MSACSLEVSTDTQKINQKAAVSFGSVLSPAAGSVVCDVVDAEVTFGVDTTVNLIYCKARDVSLNHLLYAFRIACMVVRKFFDKY